MIIDLAVQTGVAILGTVAFSVLFGVPPRHYVACGIVGGVGWLTFCLAQLAGCSSALSTFIATFALATLSRFIATRLHAPTIVFLISGIFTLVPGAGIYYMAYELFMDSIPNATHNMAYTFQTAIAITLGIGVSYLVPMKLLGWQKKPPVWNDFGRDENPEE